MHQPQSAVHQFPLRIYVKDTDVSGYVYHANYLAYAERARTEMLRELRIDAAGMVERGEGMWVVAESRLRYHRPAKLDDSLLLLSRPVEVGAATTTLEQRFLRGEELLTELRITVAWVTLQGRPQRQPREWRDAFQQIADATKDAW